MRIGLSLVGFGGLLEHKLGGRDVSLHRFLPLLRGSSFHLGDDSLAPALLHLDLLVPLFLHDGGKIQASLRAAFRVAALPGFEAAMQGRAPRGIVTLTLVTCQ